LVIALFYGLSSLVAAQSGPSNLKPTVILISIDGFRYDYPEKARTPNLHRLISGGVRADGLIPQFPTLTFPNHYSMVTGLVPAHNGIVANTMSDPALNSLFKMTDRAQVADAAAPVPDMRALKVKTPRAIKTAR
jgi:predicted AlkP superfamily pyrophosphatase or phosphodiesterase